MECDVLQTSRRGRVRYPPLAFWMHETKVHDKQGGAIAIQRPAPSPAPPTHPKPPPHTGHAPLARAQPGTQACQPTASATHSRAQTKPDSEAEAQSQLQSQTTLPGVHKQGSRGAAKQAQRSRKRRATSTDAASAGPPSDPPSPPFPYPILAKRAPQASRTASGLDGVKQAAQKGSSAQQSQPPAESGDATAAAAASRSQNPSSKGKSGRRVASKASADEGASDHGARAHRQGSDESEAGPTAALSPAAAAAAAAVKGSVKGGVKACADANAVLPKMKRCGTCKNCLNAKSGKQGCLVLRAIREQQARPASAANQEPQAAAYPSTADKPTATTAAGAEPVKAAEPKATDGTALHKEDKASKCTKGAKAGRGAASKQATGPDRNGKALGGRRASKASKACLQPDGSIHCALTQAVELASDMEQPDTAEAAEVLESLKNSPVGSGAPQPAALGLVAAATEQIADAVLPEGNPGEAAEEGLPAKRGRGRPRQGHKLGEEAAPASVRPNRGRGRPRKSPPQPVPSDAVQASGSGGSLPAVSAVQPESSPVPAVPLKVSSL